MTPEQKAAFVNAQVAVFNAEIAGMVAANMQREHLGEAMAYDEAAFCTVSQNYESTIGHNAVISFFHD